jgi:predicted ester cyclase
VAIDTVKIIEDMIAAMNSWDLDKVASYFIDDCLCEDVPSGKVCHGIKEYIDLAKMVREEFPDRSLELKSAFSDGHKIASESVWSGTFANSRNPERPATGSMYLFVISLLQNCVMGRYVEIQTIMICSQYLNSLEVCCQGWNRNN